MSELPAEPSRRRTHNYWDDKSINPPDVCELCGGEVFEHACKVKCENCGYTRDCSDP